MDLVIKLVEETKEIVCVHQIMLAAFAQYSSHEVPSSAMNETASSIQKEIQNGLEQAILCFINEKPLGSVRFIVDKDSLYFKRLSVSPAARGKGLAKEMIKWLEEYAKAQGKEKVYCRVRKDTQENIEFYQSFNFKISKEETIINKDGNVIDTVLMEKGVKEY